MGNPFRSLGIVRSFTKPYNGTSQIQQLYGKCAEVFASKHPLKAEQQEYYRYRFWEATEELEGRILGIRVNDQWRVCFVWRDGDAYDVEIVDSH